MNNADHSHLNAQQLQAFLDGEMSRKALAAAEEHLSACARCSSELEAWRGVFADLGELARHAPHEGFAERVMTGVEVPEYRPLVARLRDRVAAALSAHEDSHVPGEVLQDFLDGSLAARRAHRIEAHLARCSVCTAEADSWLGVMRRLDELDSFEPAEGFADRVLARVDLPERVPLAARLRRAIDGLFGTAVPEHPSAGILQDLVDGALPETAVARVEGHVDECDRCADELESWRLVAARLGSLDEMAPSEGFSDRVMAGLAAVTATAAASRPVPGWKRVLAAARSAVRRVVPETRQAVAALSGAAVTPMVVIGLAVWSVWSHPTLTMGSLVSFAWWQLSDLAGATLSTVSVLALRSAEVFGLYSLFETLASAPALVAGGVLAYTMICALALRVLYKNLYANRSPRGRHTHVPTAT